MISRDESILESNSVSAGRMLEYGNLCAELHIIVLYHRSRKTQIITQKNAKGFQLSKNVFVYSTNSFLKIFSIFTAYRCGRKIIRDSGLGIRDWVITTQDPFETGLVGLWLKKKFKIGFNVQAHGDFFGNPYFESESFLNKIRLKMAARVVKNTDSIRVVSERIKKTIVSMFNFPEPKIVVAPIFTDIQKIQVTQPKFDLHERFPESNLILLWVGRMGKVKNLSFLLKAFKYILEAFPKAILILAGDGPEETRMNDLAKKLGIADSVHFEGGQQDLVSYYKTADIFVFPSLYEGWGRVIVEAAAAGLPVVMSDVGCAGEVIKNGESGEVVAINDLEGFVRSVTKVEFNLDLRKKYKEAAFQNIRNLPTKSQTFELIKKSWELCAYQ